MDVNIILFITNIALIILCVGLFMIMPQLTRKSLLFGVRIPSEAIGSEEAKDMKSRFIRICVISGIFMLIACVAQYIIWPEMTILATMYFPLVFIPIYFLAFVPNWKKAVDLKSERGWVVPYVKFADTKTSQTRGNLSSMPWAWYVISGMIIVAIFVIAVFRYPELPDMIAANLDENFQPRGDLVEKTWLTVLAVPLINLAMLALMVVVGICIEKVKLQIDQDNPRLSFAQHRVYRRRIGHSLGFLTLAIVVVIAISWLPIVYPDSNVFGATLFWTIMALAFIPTIFIIVIMIKTGQGGSKVKINISEEDAREHEAMPITEVLECGRGDDKYWKLGTFYYNPDDPALIIEDRFGTNIGFNYARLPAKILIGITVIALIATYAWITIALPSLV